MSDLVERVLNRCIIGDCWTWTGTVFKPNGYGRIWPGQQGGTHYTHRIVWQALVGEVPEGLQLDHMCRNRRCCNPDHLRVVTALVNTRAGYSPAQVVRRTGLCKHDGHDMADAYFYESTGKRQCRKCAQRRDREKKARNKKRTAKI